MEATSLPGAQLATFAACLFEPADLVEVRRLVYCTHTGRSSPGGSTFHRADELHEQVTTLARLNVMGTHPYAGALPRRAVGGMSDADVPFARVAFVDFDDTTVEVARERIRIADLPTPTLTLNSGHGVHAYWRFDEPLDDLNLWRDIQKRLIQLLGSDASIHNPSRIMRLPGFRNLKKPSADCRIVEADPSRTYSIDDFTASLDNAQEPLTAPEPANGNGHAAGESVIVPTDTTARLRLISRGYAYAASVANTTTGRNVAAFPLAAFLRRDLGLTEPEAWPVMEGWNAGNDPPLDANELRTVLKNGASYAGRPEGHALRFDAAGIELPPHLVETPLPAPGDVLTHAERLTMFPTLRDPVIHGILRKGETMNIIAPAKVGKSWLVNNLALCIASGMPWMGHQVEGGRVLIVDNELHDETSTYRLAHVAEAMSLPPDLYQHEVYTLGLRGALRDIVRLGSFFGRVDPGSFKVVIIDAFYRALPAAADENSNGDMASLYNQIDRYANEIGCCFVLIHHTSKGIQAGKGVTDVGSGAGSISRAADAHIVLRQHEEDDVFVMDGAVRSWPRFVPKCIRWQFPLWHPAPEHDPSRLRKEGSRKRDPAPPMRPPEEPELTPDEPPVKLSLRCKAERFADMCTDGELTVKSLLIERANEHFPTASKREVADWLEAAIHMGFIGVVFKAKVKHYVRNKQ